MNCLDAETLAAWIDGGLSGAALEDVRSHVADCARCQSLVGAMARTGTAVAPPLRERSPRWWLAWVVPLTAAATALAIWVAVPRQANVPAAAPPAATAPAANEPPATARETIAAAPTAQKQEANEARAVQPRADDAARRTDAPELLRERAQAEADVKDQRALSAPAAAPPAAPPQAETAARAAAPSANVVAQRAGVAGIGALCGATWTTTPASVELTAGSAPSTNVCWVVGRGGAVFRSIDGRTWQRIAFPEMTDLSAVRATDDRTASVATADGRSFTTSDGGLTWARQ